MVKKKVDPRVRGLIEHGVKRNHRSLFILVGDHGKDQVENLHKILSRTRVRARPSVLWCYKKELGFSTHRKKRMKEIKKAQSRGLYDTERDDPFELFISSADIRWTYYKDSDKVLGQTFGMCVLQDFEALTPNLLARTIETVEGGGLVIILLKTVKSLKQLYTMTMDVHSRFRTEAHHQVVPRFNERFILSLGECSGCLVLDDELNILPISSAVQHIPSFEGGDSNSSSGVGGGREGLAEGDADASGFFVDPELAQLKRSLADTPRLGALIEQARTLDQAQAVLSFMDAVTDHSMRATISLTAARGRGKSAAIGICLAGAVAHGYSNVFVTAPSPENLKTVFEFLISGLKALKYTEHLDFEVIQEHRGDAIGKVVVRVNIFKNHRQAVQYILPTDHLKLAQAELVAIDEAAAIPLPIVKRLLGPYLVFMSSTVNGYEGTGRSLSLKLIQQLRTQQGAAAAQAAAQAGAAVSGPKRAKGDRHLHEDRWAVAAQAAAAYSKHGSTAGGGSSSGVRALTEIELSTPIRYSAEDPVERWLNKLLCLDVANTAATRLLGVMPAPKDCDLYVVDRDALFSYHPLAEALLQRIWALYTAAHYKNTPNDLQMLSDAPAHRLFILLGPQKSQAKAAAAASSSSQSQLQLPDVLCVIQVAFEGRISQKSVQNELNRGNKASGDLIPWVISQQYCDQQFPSLSGARIVRVATHPDVQNMGYGSRAVDLLTSYFQGDLTVETLHPSLGEFGREGSGLPTGTDEDDIAVTAGGGDLQGEAIKPKKKLPSLLTPIVHRPAELLHWIGVSFGLTSQLLNFWNRKGFKVCYLRQTRNELTGEHSAIVMRELDPRNLNASASVAASLADAVQSHWLDAFVQDYRRRLVSLMSYTFRSLETAVAITLLDPDRTLTATAASADMSTDAVVADAAHAPDQHSTQQRNAQAPPLTVSELTSVHVSHYDLKRLELYSRNMVDHHMITDTLPVISRLLFLGRLPAVRLSFLQVAILLSIGLQHRDVDDISQELNLPANQVLAFFNKTLRKITAYLRSLVEAEVTSSGAVASKQTISQLESRAEGMLALPATLAEDQQDDANEFAAQQQQKQQEIAGIMKHPDLTKHSIKADIGTLSEAFENSTRKQQAIPSSISVPRSKDAVAQEAVAAVNYTEAVKETPRSSKKKHQPAVQSKSTNKKQGKKRELVDSSDRAELTAASNISSNSGGSTKEDGGEGSSKKSKKQKHRESM